MSDDEMDPTSQRYKVNGLLAKLPVNFDSVGVYTDPDWSKYSCLGAFGAAASLESCTLTDLIFILDTHVLRRLCDDKAFKREFTFPKCLTGLLEIFMEFLSSESDVEAAFVLLVFSLVVECQARGPQTVARILLEMRKETGLHWFELLLHTNKKEEMSQQFCLKFLRRFLFIRAIVPVIRTRRQMIDFALDMVLKVLDCPEFHNKSLKEELLKEKGDHQVFQGDHQVFPFIVPKNDQLDPVGLSLLIDVMADRNRSFSFEGIATTERAPVFASSVIDVLTGKAKPFYEDTMLRWLIQRTVSEELDGRVIGRKSMNLKSLNIQHACIELEVSGIDIKYFLATVGNKTLEEVGYGEKLSYHVHYEQAFKVETPASPAKPTEEGKLKRKCRKSRSKGKTKRGSKSELASSCHEAIEKTLRLAHSESFEPVLNELKPRLREVREKLSARYLQRDEPKKRVVVTKEAAVAGKENEVNYRPTPQSEAKAGKMVHRILVGHPDYLFKPLPSKNSRQNGTRRVSTLDLHGFEAEEARSKLDKCLVHWMEEAMVEYPFVTRVDIVCGGGAQVLADVVAGFIRRTPQVANRPKGLTVV
ncbi:hypothetical protein THAOC_15936 [Thalassiosira oceanica]|uniref:Smr domain-containing protein n=1 Tax=Thalassiosira oceanica TaxID=159749 RepID=K0SDE1_THAOC|nr:hypothetical protein THAOC_15936 [Thalassiosira oceanica]|eukprot:EJK63400.1 hypothetical protein THAOC_15936 [Thalassiosira oceanica]